MDHKPDKQTLIAYLYGELEEAEQEKVRSYLEKHPEAQARLDSLQDVRHIIKHIPERPVVAPVMLLGDKTEKKARPMWIRALNVAAALALLFMAASLVKLRVEPTDNSLTLSWGEVSPSQVVAQQAPIDEAALKQWMSNRVNQRSDSLNQNLVALENELLQQLALVKRQQAKELVATPEPELSEAQLSKLTAQVQQENYKMMTNLVAMSNQQQRAYTRELLTELADYIDVQRTDDLALIKTAYNHLVEKTDLKQKETELILTQLITKIQEDENISN